MSECDDGPRGERGEAAERGPEPSHPPTDVLRAVADFVEDLVDEGDGDGAGDTTGDGESPAAD